MSQLGYHFIIYQEMKLGDDGMYSNQPYSSMSYNNENFSTPIDNYSNYTIQSVPEQTEQRIIIPQGVGGGQPIMNNPMGAQYYPVVQQPYQPMGQPNWPMNQPYQPMGQQNWPMNQPYHPMGQQNWPMNQPYHPMGQQNWPMNQPYQPMGQQNWPMNQPYQPMGQPYPVMK